MNLANYLDIFLKLVPTEDGKPDSVQFQREIQVVKLSHPGLRSSKYLEFGHFTFIVVLRRITKKCRKMCNAHAEPIVLLLKPFI